MNRGEIRTAVKEWAFDTSDAIASAATVNRWIDLACKEIAGSHDWSFLKRRATASLAAAGETVDLASDVRTITKVSYTNSSGAKVPVYPVSDRWMQNNYYDTSATGAPVVYTDGGYSQSVSSSSPVRVLRVAPVADAAYTLNVSYILTPSSMMDDTSVPTFPAGDFDQLIMLWVMRQYARQLQDYDAVTDHKQAYDSEMQRLLGIYGPWQKEKFDIVDDQEYSRIAEQRWYL